MQQQRKLTWCMACLAAFVSGCSPSSDRPAGTIDVPDNGTITVYVVNYPLKYFAERIGGAHVRVNFPAPADEDPAYWKPGAETIAAYQQADLILLNGASYDKWTRTVSLPDTKVVDTTAAVVDQYITVQDSVTHSHGPGGEHAHTGTAFTTWLDPQIASAQAEAIQLALARLRPQHAAEFQENLAALSNDLHDLDQELSVVVEGKSDRPLFFSHPVYQYLQRRYKLNAKSVHWEPKEVPSQKMWEELAGMREQHPASWMVWEGTPSNENVKRLESLGLRSTVFDTCGNVPGDADFLEVMRQNTANLRRALED